MLLKASLLAEADLYRDKPVGLSVPRSSQLANCCAAANKSERGKECFGSSSMEPIALQPTWEGISSSISRGTGEASFLLSPLGCFAWLRQDIDLLSCCNRVLK
ncbi:hypothetical protein U1Q18_016116 [Sarracenia purpurea var. burkii]